MKLNNRQVFGKMQVIIFGKNGAFDWNVRWEQLLFRHGHDLDLVWLALGGSSSIQSSRIESVNYDVYHVAPYPKSRFNLSFYSIHAKSKSTSP